jgi:nitrate/nitrite transport system ATP-binding protein
LQDEISRIWDENHKTVVMITNDPDEGIYLADRIIPLTAGPGATLGPSFQVGIPRPRDRKAINHDPHFKDLRRQVTEYLLGAGGRHRTTVTRTLHLPDLEPEDLSLPRTLFGVRRRAVRRNEIKRETVEV